MSKKRSTSIFISHADSDHVAWGDVIKGAPKFDIFVFNHHGLISYGSTKGRLTDRRNTEIGSSLLKILESLRWMFGGKGREHWDLTTAELKRDKRQMLSAGSPHWYIRLCLCWSAVCSGGPIVWHRFVAVLKEVAGAADLIRKIGGRR